MRGFIYELKRRNVLKVAAGYALVAWILIESGSVLMPTFGVPDWFFKVYVLMVFGGFIVAMIIAWVFEITPEGVRLESEIDRRSDPPPERGGLNVGLIALLAVALMVSITLNFTGLGSTADDGSGAAPDEATWVAVLPFENRSVDPENAFLTDGIHDDLMDRLQQIDTLQVTSRTSVNAFRESTKSLREIGEELGVSTIVEGSVQRSGDQVKVIVRVFDADTEERLWSDTFDRDASLQSVFELQSEISARIVAALPISSADTGEDARPVPTNDPVAFAAYVEGVNLLDKREYGSLELARSSFERAIAIDPRYARAYAKLAETIMVLHTNHKALTLDEASSIAADAVGKALDIDPLLADAYAARGLIGATLWMHNRVGDGNRTAAADYDKALTINPNLSSAKVWYATLLENENRIDDAIDMLSSAMELDPRNRIPYVNMPGLLALQGRTGEAIQLLLYTLDLFPGWSLPYDYLAQHLQGLGRIDEAVAWSVRLRELSDDPLAASNSLGLYRLLGYESEIDAFIEAIPAGHPVIPIGRGYERFIRGDYAAARAILKSLENTEYASVPYYYSLLSRIAVLLGDFPQARTWLERGNPRLSSDTLSPIDRFNASDAALLGFVELELGNAERAARLLDGALDVTRRVPRIGHSGYGILDVRVLAMKGRISDALDAFEVAVNAGFVSNVFFDLLEIDIDPLLDPLRDEERFIAARERMQARLDEMAERVDTAIRSGDWEPLRDRTRMRLELVSERR